MNIAGGRAWAIHLPRQVNKSAFAGVTALAALDKLSRLNNQTKAYKTVTGRSRQPVAADKGTPQTAAKTRTGAKNVRQ
jgi:hypothetical protein